MKIQNINGRGIALTLGLVMVLGAPLLPARAQDAGGDTSKPVSLNLLNVPVGTALRTLFGSAGIRNYTIAPDVQGSVNINVSDVPFTLALRQLLSSLNPPATFEVDNGTYNVKLQSAVATTPTATVAPTTANGDTDTSTATTANQPKRFYTIPIDQYDAYYIATLVGQQGIVEVIPNYPATSSGNGQGGQNGQGGNRGFGGGSGGFGGGLSSPVTTVGGGSGFGGGGFGGGGFGGSSFGGGFGR